MTSRNPIESLDGLKTALSELEKFTLPQETRAALYKARHHLEIHETSLSNTTEHARLIALYQVSKSLGDSLNLDDVLTKVMDSVIDLTGAERGFLMLVQETTGDLQLKAARNIERKTIEQVDLDVSRSVIQKVINSGEGVVTTDAQNDPRFSNQNSIILYSLRSIICTPLRTRNRVLGVIYVDNRAQSGIFGKEDLALLKTFASQAAVAIDNATHYTKTDHALAQRVTELEILQKIDKDLNAELDLPRVLKSTCRWALMGSNGLNAWVLLKDTETQEFHVMASSTPDEKFNLEFLKSFSELKENLIIPARNDDPSFLLTPIHHSGELIGGIIISGQQGKLSEANQFLINLSGRAASAIENAQLYQAVQAANNEKSQFVATVTHELRIPLTSIKGYTDLIQQGLVGPVSEQQSNFLDIIKNNVERMASLISDLSDISRIERGKFVLEPKEISIIDQVNITIDNLRPKIEEKKQSITVNIPENIPNITADPNRVVQVLNNLISNAWKYSPSGGQITITAFRENGQIRTAIIDNGIGISDDDQEKLFSQFFRSENPVVRDETGWGLGLNVTRRIIEVMGGNIGFNSKLGEGSNFWFTLPVVEN